MFCHKCGNKSPEGAVFCQKCGAKLINDETKTQSSVKSVKVSAPVSAETTAPPIEPTQQEPDASVPEIQEAYDRLKDSAERCPKIKKIDVSQGAKGAFSFLRIHGFFNRYVGYEK